MDFKRIWINASFAGLLILPGCGGSPSPTHNPQTLRPSADPVAAYKSVIEKADAKVHPGLDFVRYCQPITTSTSRQCREKVVENVAAETEVLGLLDGATVPEKFKTLHAALRMGIVKAVALHTEAARAIDSGNGTQAALDAAFAQMRDNVFPVFDRIELG
jgi:hypothetical protein